MNEKNILEAKKRCYNKLFKMHSRIRRNIKNLFFLEVFFILITIFLMVVTATHYPNVHNFIVFCVLALLSISIMWCFIMIFIYKNKELALESKLYEAECEIDQLSYESLNNATK